MGSTVRVTRGEHTSSYVIDDEREDGSLLIRPQTQLEQMLEELGSRRLTEQEFDELIAPHVGPPDGEG